MPLGQPWRISEGVFVPRDRVQLASIHRAAERDCLKSSPGSTTAPYPPVYEEISN
jgi:hypothetical protein